MLCSFKGRRWVEQIKSVKKSRWDKDMDGHSTRQRGKRKSHGKGERNKVPGKGEDKSQAVQTREIGLTRKSEMQACAEPQLYAGRRTERDTTDTQTRTD